MVGRARVSWDGWKRHRALASAVRFRHSKISFLTDIEGDKDYFHRFVDESKVLKFEDDGTTISFQRDQDHLVFGGDIWDQGGADCYVLKQLLHLKRRYSGQVHWVWGNRDINKLRISQELFTPDHKGVYWLSGTGKVGDPHSSSCDPVSEDSVSRLQWMLGSTMGSPRAYAYRKSEIQESQLSDGEASDDDVVQSYWTSCLPSGDMGQYLQMGQPGLQLGDVLFLHGALPLTDIVLRHAASLNKPEELWDDCTWAMPWLNGEHHSCQSPQDWLKQLNKFGTDQIKNWANASFENDICEKSAYWSIQGGYQAQQQKDYSSLMQYGMGWVPGGSRNPTVIYAGWTQDGMPRKDFFDSNSVLVRLVKCFMERTGIRVIVSGHQPQGDCPQVIRINEDDEDMKLLISADTSYSGDVEWSMDNRQARGREGALSGRGRSSVSEVILEQDQLSTISVHSHGVFCNGSRYQTLPYGIENRVGRVNQEDPEWWTRAVLMDGTTLLGRGEGFRQWSKTTAT